MKIQRLSLWLSLLLLACAVAAPLSAQDERPINPAPPTGISIDDIINKFVQKETDFAQARSHYTYRQTVKVQTLDGDTPDGEYQQVVDINFDPSGKRVEEVVFAPQSTIERVQMTREDFDTFRILMPFVMTNQTRADYQINYLGQQKVDELDTYVFEVAPKQVEKGKIYFQGRVWVDNRDLQIVMTHGTTIIDQHDKKAESKQQFPKFTTWREQIDGVYWFPTYSRADETLHFPGGRNSIPNDVHIREIVKYTNYKRFGSDVKITYDGKVVDKADSGQPQQPGAQPKPKPPQH